MRLMATADEVTGPMNLGNPGELTIKQLAEIVIEMIGSGSRLVYKPLPSDDPRQRRPDITSATETLGWRPGIELKEGLTKTIAYFDEYLTQDDTAFMPRTI